MDTADQVNSPVSPKSESSSVNLLASSPYRRRFDRRTRREAWEKFLKKPTKLKEDPSSPISPHSNDGDSYSTSMNDFPTSYSTDNDDVDGKRLEKAMASVSFKVRSSARSKEAKESFGSGLTAATTVTATTASSATEPPGYASLREDAESMGKLAYLEDGEPDIASYVSRQPQHVQPHVEEQDMEPRFYRVSYRGVVALVSRPDSKSQKSGTYVSYGEIIVSYNELEVEEVESVATIAPETKGASFPSPNNSDHGYSYPDSPPRSVLSHCAGSVSSLDTLKTASSAGAAKLIFPPKHHVTVVKRAIRVDKVLTGGYAVDASESSLGFHVLKTPKRSNSHYLPIIGPPPVPLGTSPTSSTGVNRDAPSHENLGYLFAEKKGSALVEELSRLPLMEHGKYIYQVSASTPLPILTGPCLDAPRTKAMLLPGTVHEVCLRIIPDDRNVTFLRLSHRRGWIVDRKISFQGGHLRIGAIPAVKEITHVTASGANESMNSALSIASSSVSTPGSVARRRHRPPRRKQDTNTNESIESKPMSWHVQPKDPFMTPARNQRPGKSTSPAPMSEKLMTPSSNVSVLSDDNIFETAISLDLLTPDRYNPQSQRYTSEPAQSYYLMKVNAPHGLKILDAPHFQVSNLIHGPVPLSTSQASTSYIRPETGSTISAGRHSIFQTMGQGAYTTNSTLKVGNPAIFDSVKKSRVLPRGAIFEALTRMESSSSFSQGAGLIKLSDHSGWAIVPKQDELDCQYRNYHGGVSGVKEGEATRAFEEIGNAIIPAGDDSQSDPTSTIWVRITSRGGAPVECPPPMPELLNNGDISPTSSAGNSSISGAGSNYGILSAPDSDVASSVGSAFLDAIFNTPVKRKSDESRTAETGLNSRYKKLYSTRDPMAATKNVLACGICVEVEKWEANSMKTDKCVITQDYLRIRGGQGWFARVVHGKSVAEIVPKPIFRFGSFWFRVLSPHGIKVRSGPSRRANAIKSGEDVYFRFECGEFLRASVVMTIFKETEPGESFATLFRNRHILMYQEKSEVRLLSQMALHAEWVQIYGDDCLYLEECAAQPRIQRHRDGWRYNVVKESGVHVRKGPSFAAETVGPILLPGKSVLINERVTPPGEKISWLRLKDGMGWVHDIGTNDETFLIAHALRHRSGTLDRHGATGADRSSQSDAAYNAIVARLFTQQEAWMQTKSDAYQSK
jgi:hypothetical protein